MIGSALQSLTILACLMVIEHVVHSMISKQTKKDKADVWELAELPGFKINASNILQGYCHIAQKANV